MADIETFPTRATILVTDPQIAPLRTFTASEVIYAGQVVTVDPTTGDNYVTPGDLDNAAPVIGIALYGAASGAPITVCTAGCICYVANESGSAAVGEGSTLMLANANVAGTVLAYASGAAYIVGIALEDIAANGWGRALVMPYAEVVS